MKTHTLGNQGLTVSTMGLRCMGMSEFYGAGDEQESMRIEGGGRSVRAAWATFWLATDSPRRPTRPPSRERLHRTPTSILPTADPLLHEENDEASSASHMRIVYARGHTSTAPARRLLYVTPT
jgi:hypothetical protein